MRTERAITGEMESPSTENLSLLEWMCERFPESPKKRIKSWFEGGRVTLDGEVVRRFHEPMADPGERLQLAGVQTRTAAHANAVARLGTKLRIVHRDSELVIVDKSAGVLSVPAPARREPSALDLLTEHFTKTSASFHPPLPVHRLDAYTTGLLCFALTEPARANLIEQLRAGTLDREYLALVEGVPAVSSGEWRHWFQLSPTGLHQSVVEAATPGAEEAVTRFRHVKTGKYQGLTVSLLHLVLETGLRHQIRLQAAEVGLPLLGDRTYHLACLKAAKKGVPPGHPERQALHAYRLTLDHPRTGKRLSWECPLPTDLARYQLNFQ
jgi:23S rRNA pseudouridine1911/1915/1917 synthase